jgi:type II secretory pathway component GspD/PulD (secretin)
MSGIQNIQNLTNTPDGKFIGILSSADAKAALRALAAGTGVVNAEPEVVTTDGRQTQMRATQVISFITNTVFEDKMTNADGIIISNSISFKTAQMETGAVLDVVPYVLADGMTIILKTTASQVEFLGYADIPTNASLHSVTNSAGQRIYLPLVWPAMQISRESAQVNLRDNQTLVLSPNPPEQVRFAAPDEQREAIVAKHIRDGQMKGKNGETETIVFITATLVDQAGNRIHAD